MKSNIYKEEVAGFCVHISDQARKTFDLTDSEDNQLYELLEAVLDRYLGYPEYRQWN